MRPAVRNTLIAAALIVTVSCALASPVALAAIGRWWNTNWTQLSNIGQAYGAASAVFSALAVAGVGAGLIYQARQLRAAQVQLVRTRQYEIFSRVMDDYSTLAPAVGALNSLGIDPLSGRRILLASAYVQYLRIGYSSGLIPEAGLRVEVCPEFFSSVTGRQVWVNSRELWLEHHSSRTERHFAEIMDDEYQRAVRSGPPIPDPVLPEPRPDLPVQGQHRPGWAAVTVVSAAVLAAGWLAGRRR